MEGFTNLEEKAFAAFAKLSGEPDLFWQWMQPARVTVRDNSGHGFFTRFATSQPRPQWSVSDSYKNGPVFGPTFQLVGFDPGTVLEFLLWDEMLEAYQMGSHVDLKQYDLLKMDGFQVAFLQKVGWASVS